MTPRFVRLVLVVLAFSTAASCGDRSSTAPQPVPEVYGRLEVTTATTGEDPDTDGYLLRINGGAGRVVGQNVGVMIDSLAPGSYAIRLEGVATNCPLGPGDTRTLEIKPGQTTKLRFAIACVARLGAMTVVIRTVDGPGGSSGYRFVADAGSPGTVTLNDTVRLTGLREGEHLVQLLDVPTGCNVVEANPRSVAVVYALTSTATITVSCLALYTGPWIAFARDYRIFRIKPDGSAEQALTDGVAGDGSPSWSPDSRRIAFVRRDKFGTVGNGIFLMDASGANVARVTSGESEFYPSWSPDGKRIAFESWEMDAAANYHSVIKTVGVDDGSTPVLLTSIIGNDFEPEWGPSGALAFTSDRRDRYASSDIYVVGPTGSPQALTHGGSDGKTYYSSPKWSPDGRLLAVVVCDHFVIDYGDDWYEGCTGSRLAIMNADGSGLTTITAVQSYAKLSWSPDGQYILYSDGAISFIKVDKSRRGFLTMGSWPAWSR